MSEAQENIDRQAGGSEDDDKFFDFKRDSILMSGLKIGGFILLLPFVMVYFILKGAFVGTVWFFDKGMYIVFDAIVRGVYHVITAPFKYTTSEGNCDLLETLFY